MCVHAYLLLFSHISLIVMLCAWGVRVTVRCSGDSVLVHWTHACPLPELPINSWTITHRVWVGTVARQVRDKIRCDGYDKDSILGDKDSTHDFQVFSFRCRRRGNYEQSKITDHALTNSKTAQIQVTNKSAFLVAPYIFVWALFLN